MRLNVACLFVLSACGSAPTVPPDSDILGPFSGPTVRFVVDSVALPRGQDYYAIDIDGRGARFDNLLGILAEGLYYTGDRVTDSAIAQQIGAGRISPWVELQAPSLEDSPVAGLTFHESSGATGSILGGTIKAGVFSSNPPAVSHHPISGTVVFPLLSSADPLAVPSVVLHANLRRCIDNDPRCPVGWNLELHGAARPQDMFRAAYEATMQHVAAEPGKHPVLASLDSNNDGIISEEEFSAIMPSPDVLLFNAKGEYAPWEAERPDALSFGLLLHLQPCGGDSCSATNGTVSCEDRVRDGDETDVDCGGPCPPCAPNLQCRSGSDCESGTCAAGMCGLATCADSHLDGLECAVDRGPACGSSCN